MWTTPTLQQVTTDVIRGFNAGLTGADAALARNNLFPVAKVLAGHLHELHGAFDVAVRQRFVLTCDDDFLDRHGAEMKPPVPRKPASPATGFLTVTSTGAASVAGGAVFTRSDGARFL
ncbi:MAG: baseplate J/gp47 family protein, partial [Pseudomonadota bacterium]